MLFASTAHRSFATDLPLLPRMPQVGNADGSVDEDDFAAEDAMPRERESEASSRDEIGLRVRGRSIFST